jgi:hypothetical protein
VRSVRKTPGELDEERLVRLMARSDRAAFEELYRRTSPWLALGSQAPVSIRESTDLRALGDTAGC